MPFSLELWVEGPTDATTQRHPARQDDEPAGALIPIVRRTLLENSNLRPDEFDTCLPSDQISVQFFAISREKPGLTLKNVRNP